ncbi:putative oligopeptide transporter [Cercophora samala]|uniref:Oligopeptide transporter n=1 Tax=Cercophora samala TaxID=330535 RepID=A0AA39Z7M0_9PEZI|nr:putative oligopeptide transporter [Cercophora samala]
MSTVSTLVGFISFQFLQRYLCISLTPSENVLLLSVSTAAGSMAVTAGFINVIPALEFLISSEENGPLRLSTRSLVLWSIGVCLFGLAFASLFRKHFVVRERLPWPGAKGVANSINTLHRRNMRPDTGDLSADHEANGQENDGEEAEQSNVTREEALLTPQPTVGGIRWERSLQSLVRGYLLSWCLGMIIYFVPVLRELPIFGRTASKNWLWSVDFSPGFFGQGMMAGPVVPLHTMMGAVAGWGILSPYAKKQGWAPGDLWWFTLREVVFSSDATAASDKENDEDTDTCHDCSFSFADRRRLVLYFLGSVLICAASVHVTFEPVVSWYHTVLALALALPMAVVGIRSVAETDHKPECGLISQLIFGTLLSSSNPNAIITNLLSSAVSQAGASQSGGVSHKFRTGQLVGSSPQDQLCGHIIGSIVGALASCGIYRLYASQHFIPGSLFRIPAAFLFLNTARLAMGNGLPKSVAPFAIGAAVFSATSSIAKMRYADRWWQAFIPTGVSFAIGIYNTPSFTITRIMGGLFYWAYAKYRRGKGKENNDILVLASGLVLGESVAGLTGIASTIMFKGSAQVNIEVDS